MRISSTSALAAALVCALGHGPPAAFGQSSRPATPDRPPSPPDRPALVGERAAGAPTYELGSEDTWVETATPEQGTPAGLLFNARRALARGEYQRAEYLATSWIDRFDAHLLLPEAYLVRADALKGEKSYYESLFDYEHIVQTFPGSEVFITALEREYEIGLIFAGGTKRKIFGLRILDATDVAEELLIRIQERLPGSYLAEDAAMSLADFYFARRDMELAAEMYRLFVENYPRSTKIRKARRRLIYSDLASFKGPEFDGAGLHDAKTQLRQLQIIDPAAAQQMGADALLTRINESEALKMLTTARWYLKVDDPVAAEFTIRGLIRTYPRSVAARDGIRLAVSLLPDLSAYVRRTAPDYEKLAALLGPVASDAAPSEDAP